MSLNAEQLTRAITTMRAAVAVLNQVYTRDGTVADPGEVGRLRVALDCEADTLEIYSGLSSITIPVDGVPE